MPLSEGLSGGATAPPDSPASIEVDSADIIRLILQFLQEHGLPKSQAALEEESSVAMNAVPDVAAFLRDIAAGRWDAVLSQAAHMKLPPALLMDLYEQVARETCEVQEGELARGLLRTAAPLLLLRQEDPSRYARLEHLATKAGAGSGPAGAGSAAGGRGSAATGLPAILSSEAYPEGETRESVRAGLARNFAQHIQSVEPGRLLTLLGQSLRWQEHCGTLPADAWHKHDLFRGLAPSADAERRDKLRQQQLLAGGGEDRAVSAAAGSISLGSRNSALSLAFTPDGSSLISGSSDGLLELYSPSTCKLRLDVSYQSSEDFMLHEEPVLALAVSPDGSLLASGDKSGKLKVWTLQDGLCVRRFTKAHGSSEGGSGITVVGSGRGGSSSSSNTAGISCLAFSKDGSQLLSGGYDGMVKLWGLRSGKVLKELRGHSSYVTAACFSHDGSSVYSGSADGSVRVWDLRTAECVRVLRAPSLGAGAAVGSMGGAGGAAPAATVAGGLGRASSKASGGGGGGGGGGGDGMEEEDLSTSAAASAAASFSAVQQHGMSGILDSSAFAEAAVAAVMAVPRTADLILVVPRSRTACLMSASKGSVVRTFTIPAVAASSSLVMFAGGSAAAGGKEGGEKKTGASGPTAVLAGPGPSHVLSCATVSPGGCWTYLGTEDGFLYAFETATGRLASAAAGSSSASSSSSSSSGSSFGAEDCFGGKPMHGGSELLALSHHPLTGMLVSSGGDGSIRLWKP